MEKVVSNEQRLANRQNAGHSTGPLRTSRLDSTIDNRQSTIPPTSSPNSAACVQCHAMTLTEKNVLAKRTHLKPIHEKGKCECVGEKRFRSRLGSPATLLTHALTHVVAVPTRETVRGESPRPPATD